MKAYRKSNFYKLYLIEPELYNKILPLLNQLEKNELLQLNQKYSEGETVPNILENVESKSSSLQENETISNVDSSPSPQTNSDFTQTGDLPFQENVMRNNDISDPYPQYSSEQYPVNAKRIRIKSSNQQKRPKKFQCQNCTKAFTTKFSLKRHNKNFHAIQNTNSFQNEDTQEIDRTVTSENNRGMKRKLKSTVNQSENKRLKPTRGIKRNQEEDQITDATDFKQPRLETSVMGLADFSAPRGFKRQMKRVADSEPRKKTRWIDFY